MTVPRGALPDSDAGYGNFRQLPGARFLRDQNVLVAMALGGILVAVALDSIVLAMEIASGAANRPFHLLTAIALFVIFIAALLSYFLLGQRTRHQITIERIQVQQLRRAKEAAETANLVNARYLANISHEIRSPLNAIYGYAQLIEQEASVRPQEAARVIRRCAEHMTSLVESLLDISRVENGILRVRSEIVDLPEFIDQIVWMMRPAAEARGLEFRHEVTGRLPALVRTDQSRLRQALVNLLNNAIKFTDAGSVTFRVRYRGQIAMFEISDTGPGIAASDRERIFDPYERGAAEDGQARPGVGLGLSITSAIVSILGGKLELESELGEGSCFRITMMLGELANVLLPEAAGRRIIGHEGPRRSILIVDDDPDQRAFLEHYLIGCGFEVVAVPNGETAVHLCGQRPFDLCVLDISLPGMSGWEAAAQIRERMQRDLVIVMASANTEEFHRPEYHKPVHDHFFVKPYKLDEMAEAIGGLLKLSWHLEPLGELEPPPAAADMPVPVAALPHVERLQELIRIGHVRGIEAEIGMLAIAAPGSGRLITALYAALDEFDLAGMTKILKGQ